MSRQLPGNDGSVVAHKAFVLRSRIGNGKLNHERFVYLVTALEQEMDDSPWTEEEMDLLASEAADLIQDDLDEPL
jgi:hypothetical protein